MKIWFYIRHINYVELICLLQTIFFEGKVTKRGKNIINNFPSLIMESTGEGV